MQTEKGDMIYYGFVRLLDVNKTASLSNINPIYQASSQYEAAAM